MVILVIALVMVMVIGSTSSYHYKNKNKKHDHGTVYLYIQYIQDLSVYIFIVVCFLQGESGTDDGVRGLYYHISCFLARHRGSSRRVYVFCCCNLLIYFSILILILILPFANVYHTWIIRASRYCEPPHLRST